MNKTAVVQVTTTVTVTYESEAALKAALKLLRTGAKEASSSEGYSFRPKSKNSVVIASKERT